MHGICDRKQKNQAFLSVGFAEIIETMASSLMRSVGMGYLQDEITPCVFRDAMVDGRS